MRQSCKINDGMDSMGTSPDWLQRSSARAKQRGFQAFNTPIEDLGLGIREIFCDLGSEKTELEKHEYRLTCRVMKLEGIIEVEERFEGWMGQWTIGFLRSGDVCHSV